MRRARIKVTASVPARRKVTKENDAKETAKETEATATPENPPSEDKPEEINVTTEEAEIPKIPEEIPQIPEEIPKIPEVIEDVPAVGAVPPIASDNSDATKDSETTETISVPDPVVLKRPRLFSESSEGRGHLSGGETSSPAKIPNRASFMRPIPRLDGPGRIRRNSIQGSGASASESEDDSRRQFTQPHQNPPQPPQTDKQPLQHPPPLQKSTKQKRKIIISESARKLAEARREFLLKHENKQPDRTKLTMYDLIYYNPASNPMKKSQSSLKSNDAPIDEDLEDEENEDSPLSVPQLKVGPDGQLIVDEQSLVIENTSLKKEREAIAKRRILVDEEGALGGFYKKRAKSKDWPSYETLKFYKALNTVGTDFSLMQSLFPKRTRQELKMKFKKEERLNQKLVEKALTYHQEYDVETLRKEFDSFENIEAKRDKVKQIKERKINYRKKLAGKRKVATSVNLLSEEEPDEVADSPKVQKRKRQRKMDEDDESISEDDFEIYKVKPTRSGRQPRKKRSGFDPTRTLDAIFDRRRDADGGDDDDDDEDVSNTDLGILKNTLAESVPGLGSVEPGSLVIVSKESPDEPGKTLLQVYMISKDGGGGESMTPIDLGSDMLSTVTNGLSNHDVSPIKLNLK